MENSPKNNIMQYPVSNSEVLGFLSLEKTAIHLVRICNGEVQSERHNIVYQMFSRGTLDFGINSRIFRLSEAHFLVDDGTIDLQLFKLILKVFERSELSKLLEISVSSYKYTLYRHKYIYHVLVPEAILKYLQERNGWDRETAESFYVDGESRVTQQELDDFDK